MIILAWIDHFPNNNLQKSFECLEKVYWPITISHTDHLWRVYTGEPLIFSTDSQEALEAFLYGLGLTYVCYNGARLDAIHEELEKWVE